MYVCSALALVLYHAWMDFHDIVLVSTLTCSTGRLQSRSATQPRPVSDSRSPPAGLTSWGLSKVTWLALHRCCGWWTGRAGTTFSSQKVNSCSFLRRTLATSTRWILHMWYVRTCVRATSSHTLCVYIRLLPKPCVRKWRSHYMHPFQSAANILRALSSHLCIYLPLFLYLVQIGLLPLTIRFEGTVLMRNLECICTLYWAAFFGIPSWIKSLAQWIKSLAQWIKSLAQSLSL